MAEEMTTPPEFDLAELKAFDVRVIRKDYDAVDAFVLSLALVFNDLKTANWILEVVEKASGSVTPEDGQKSGMRIHASRMFLGILHELLIAISVAAKDNLLKSPAFHECLKTVGDEIAADWQALVETALSSEQSDPFRKWLVRVRNSVVSHYYQPKDLHAGYRAYFYDRATDEFNVFALASLGESMEQTRFYFADAAVGAAYDDVLDPDDKHMMDANAHARRVNNALRYIIDAYLIRRAHEESVIAGAKKGG